MPTTESPARTETLTFHAADLRIGDRVPGEHGGTVARVSPIIDLDSLPTVTITWEFDTGRLVAQTLPARQRVTVERTSDAETDVLPADRPRLITGVARRNTYAGPCRVCGMTVAAAAGVLIRRTTGTARWEVQHRTLDNCREAVRTDPPAPAARTPRPTPRPPVERPRRGTAYALPAVEGRAGAVEADGEWVQIARVSHRQRGNGWFLNVWTGYEWRYFRSGHATSIDGLSPVNSAQASAFGAAFSRCVFCGRPLDTAESISVGYGPDCAAQHYLPWGNITQADRDAAVERQAQRRERRSTRRAVSAESLAVALRQQNAAVCNHCGEECATPAEAADPEAHDCPDAPVPAMAV